MARYGPQFGPDITFLGVARCDWADPATYPGADVVILGAPFDGGTSYRSGARFGPQYIRQTCYLPHDGSRPSLALRADGLTDLRVYDAGDVEMFSGDAARSVRDLQAAVHAVTRAGSSPGRCAATGSCRSGCAATGPGRRRWPGWPPAACAPTR